MGHRMDRDDSSTPQAASMSSMDEAFFVALRPCLVDAIGLLREQEAKTPIRTVIYPDKGFDDGGYWEGSKAVLELWPFSRAVSGRFATMSTSVAAIKVLEGAGLPKRFPGTEVTIDRAAALLRVAVEYVRAGLEVGLQDPFAIDDARLRETCRASHEAWHRRGDPTPHVVIPLVGLRFAGEVLDLGNHFTIARLTPAEKTRLWRSFEGHIDSGAMAGITHALRDRDHPDLKRFRTDAQQAIFNLVSALRLLKRGSVGAPVYMEIANGTLSHRLPQLDTSRIAPEYQLAEQDVPLLMKRLCQLGALPHGSNLWLAIRRFNQACSDRNQEDVIVDLTVALEATLLGGEEKELSFRTSLWGAALLGDARDPRQTYEMIRLIYDARSALVHGADNSLARLEKKIAPRRMHDFVRDATDLVREVLIGCVQEAATGGSGRLADRLRDRVLLRLDRRPAGPAPNRPEPPQ